ncbi:Flp family type IVb pilin [Pelosinus fermentans]|uniref:Flp/Fap pilin component n=1 Tax=Pelosinus fermentans JBW45 TaxID=1192197 RepID=I8TQD9_9FIRM|nr:hypothetical protein [Pelosinus fermentans]AJQ26832.1 Flp/Fap pilin component [Pelosinus fermentans JBW45]
MLTYLNHFKMRYLNEKGQGMVEYAVILAVVVAIGLTLTGTEGVLSKGIKDMFTNIMTKAKTIVPL